MKFKSLCLCTLGYVTILLCDHFNVNMRLRLNLSVVHDALLY
ncbi:Uncharacterised protein [Shewanella morhuae]|uniref:Uncharacterized protein n=1 Tax=Shewanella morhuae TaxID=365591 RepID=A0A380B031_9GAMM|nr:Uncharacterised protein [Shewanella morhuae]